MEYDFEWEKYGFEIIFKTTNQDFALEKIKQLNPDVICTDMRMPRISGIELIKAAKAMNEDVECIIVSGYEDFQKACEAIQYKVIRYCLKPLDREKTSEILLELKMLLDEKHACNSSPSIYTPEENAVYLPNIKFRNMQAYISSHFKDPLSLEELSEMFEINASFASRLFTQYYKIGYSQYLANLRLRKASELLKSTSISIDKISFLVGFNDSAYFSRLFKKHYLETPYNYRFHNHNK